MNSTTTTSTTTSSRVPQRPTPPSWRRRTAVAVTGFLTCALPVVFTINITHMLVSGIEPDHRFHQATGQGLCS